MNDVDLINLETMARMWGEVKITHVTTLFHREIHSYQLCCGELRDDRILSTKNKQDLIVGKSAYTLEKAISNFIEAARDSKIWLLDKEQVPIDTES